MVALLLCLNTFIIVHPIEAHGPYSATLNIQLPEDFIPEEHYARNNPLFIPSGEQQTFDPATTIEYVIITHSTFWSTFNQNYKNWKIQYDDKINSILLINISDVLADPDCWVTGQYGDGTPESSGNPWVEDEEQVSSEYYSLFNDSQAIMRNFIRKCVSEYNTSYVLLAGNKDFVPVRMVCSYAHAGPGGSWYNDTSHACDMYFSNLHKNWNDNFNSRWGENTFGAGVYWVTVNDYDDIDWYYDVLVGRVLISSTTEANRWINKVKAYVMNNDVDYLNNGIVASKNVYNQIDDYVWETIGDEFPDDMVFLNGEQITQTQWNQLDDYANGDMPGWGGFSLIHHSGHGGTLWSPYSPSYLDNDDIPNFLYTEGCNSADYGTDSSSRMEQWMQDDGAIFGGIGNSAYGWFVASTWYGEEMFDIMFNAQSISEPVIAKAHFQSRENIGWTLHSVAPMIYKETNYFGDPALEFHLFEPALPPEFSDVNPENNTINHPLELDWNITVSDPNGELFELNISCDNGQYVYYESIGNGVYGIHLMNLLNDTYYNISVMANDTNGNMSTAWYQIRTKPETYDPWDINEDGYCDYLDISGMVSQYGEEGTPGWIPEDVVEDGVINYLDISMLTSHYGESY